jgi:hypothetical protein
MLSDWLMLWLLPSSGMASVPLASWSLEIEVRQSCVVVALGSHRRRSVRGARTRHAADAHFAMDRLDIVVRAELTF